MEKRNYHTLLKSYLGILSEAEMVYTQDPVINSPLGDFPGGPVAKTPRSQCRGPGFDPWLGN